MVDGVVTSATRPSADAAGAGRAADAVDVAKLRAAAIGIDFDDPALDEAIRRCLITVEESLAEVVRSVDPLLDMVAHHLIDAGGKRFRPLLVALAAQFGDPTVPEVPRAGVVVELTHLATLYHDDVMDEAPVRRGAPSVNMRWGNSIAILAGDHLFAQAADLAVDLGIEAVRLQAQTFGRLVRGQIAETAGPRGEDPIAHHLFVNSEKTGSLIGTSARFGAMFSGAPSAQIEALAEYGEVIGVAFQLSDDLVDIASESAQ